MMLTRSPSNRLPAPQLRKLRRQIRKDTAKLVASCKRRFTEGDKGALLEAVLWRLISDPQCEDWLKEEFRKAYRSTKFEFKHATWDEVFGKPHPSNLKLPAQRQASTLKSSVYREVRRQHPKEKGYPTEDVFESVAEKFPAIKARTVKRYFDDYRSEWGEYLYDEPRPKL